jgi:hypothetical protein
MEISFQNTHTIPYFAQKGKMERSSISVVLRAIDEGIRRATVPPKAMVFHLTVLALAHTTESLPEPTEPGI